MSFAIQGALRLEPSGPSQGRRGAAPDLKDGSGGDANYYNKLITLFPAEALTLYGTGVAVFGRSTFGALVACLAVLIILRWIATMPKTGGPPHVPAVVVAVASFLLWTTATDPDWLIDWPFWQVDAFETQKWAAFLGAAFVLLAPILVRAPEPLEPQAG